MASSDQDAVRRHHNHHNHPKYYFAYGSNLHMQQMQQRCPNSKYIGLGLLPDFQWQINERGFANVVHAVGHRVIGLVYELDEDDERELDICEGVSQGAYEKQYMSVETKLAGRLLYRRPVSWVVAHGGPSGFCEEEAKDCRDGLENPIEAAFEDVLIYISPVYVTDGTPREEYVGRMNRGLRDAASLGMEQDYVRDCIRPFVPEA